ncbi:unnamed protein product, partial [Symbiodinium sp. CCMP2592]
DTLRDLEPDIMDSDRVHLPANGDDLVPSFEVLPGDVQKPKKYQDPKAQEVCPTDVQPEKSQDPDALQVRPADVQKPEKSQDPDAQQVRPADVQKPLKSQDPQAQQVRPADVQKPEKSQDPQAQQVRPADVQKPEKSQDPQAQQVRPADVQKPEKSQDPQAQQVRPGKSQDPDAPQVRPGDVQPEKSQDPQALQVRPGTQQDRVSPNATACQSRSLNRPRHLDSQSTMSLGAYQASPSRAEIVCDALLEHGLPGPDEAGDCGRSPPALLEYVFGKTGEKAKSLGELQRTIAIVQWTRKIGDSGLAFMDVDATHGHLAKALYDTAVLFSKDQGTLEKHSKDLDKHIGIITSLADKKRAEIMHIKDPAIFKEQLRKIDNWTIEKMKEKRDFVCKESERVHVLQLNFANALLQLLDAVEAEHDSRCTDQAPEVDICMDLEEQLQALMLEDSPDRAAGRASPPGKPLLAVKDEVPGFDHDAQGSASVRDSSPMGSQAEPIETTKTTDPGPEAMVEDEETTREAKRLQHNARVTFDRRVKSGDCPPEILEKVQTWKDRLKQLGALFQEWYKGGQDFMATTIMQEATKKVSDEARGKQVMMSFKAMKDKFGKKSAERIRDRKKEEEKNRNVKTEPRPFWFSHPELDDPDWEMFRCFDSLEFELWDTTTTTTGFHASASLHPDATAQLAPLLRDMAAGGGDRMNDFGMSAGGMVKSSSLENIPNPNPDKPNKKVNQYAQTKKLNGKIQQLSAKLTDIMVWLKEVDESNLLPLGPSSKTKEGYGEQLRLKNDEIQTLKSEMEQLYSTNNKIQDKDLTLEARTAIDEALKTADVLTIDFTGCMRPIKLALASFKSARETMQAMKEELGSRGISMTGPCAKLEVPIDMVDVPIKPELSLGMATIAAYMRNGWASRLAGIPSQSATSAE